MSCSEVKKTLLDQLNDRWLCRPSRGGEREYILVTDFLLPNNDCVELTIQNLEEDGFRIHDRALSYTFLRSSGIDLASSSQRNRRNQIEGFASRFNTSLEGRRIEKKVKSEELWKGVTLVFETIKSACGLIKSRQAQPQNDFQDRVYGYFKRQRVRVKRNYTLDGYSKKNKFDIRLNGADSVLCRTISSKSSSRVLSQVERAWFAFDDATQAGHHFDPAVIYDDTEKDRREAWTRDHFQILRKREIPAFGFSSNEDQLRELAEDHRG
ncbi:DUF1828 domain-containing protein [Salinibacter sp.]|jgi:hypothetical protein|uniref:DUF1828 domain-containing protein n=1 Tax=Salinibacter sp. TaxID=2065818 RepID=UPI0021E82BD5|nr:DUF1828 domain-containing protein [Salinibacter sp.]